MGVAGRFPPTYMGAMVQGQALGGIIAVSTNIIMLAFGMSDKSAAFWDFLIATVYLALSLVAFVVVTKTEFYQVISQIKVYLKTLSRMSFSTITSTLQCSLEHLLEKNYETINIIQSTADVYLSVLLLTNCSIRFCS